jgi:phosphatidylinositol alpha-mannosyltransferase
MWHSTLPAPNRKLGGVEVHVHRLSNRLVQRGHEVHVFSLTPAPADAAYRHTRVGATDMHRSRLKRITLGSLLLNRLDVSADLLHLHGDDWFFFRRRLPTLRTFYGSSWREAQTATSLKRRVSVAAIFPLELVAARLATKAYAISPDLARIYGVDGLLPCAVDVPADRDVERPGAPTILFVGTWAGRKRGALLFEVFQREVRPRVPDARLIMVCERSVTGPGVESVAFPTDDELTALYRRARVFCLPSSYEGFGIPYLEAISQGTPVVSTVNPGAVFVLDGGRAGVIAPLESLGDTLVRLLTDEEHRRQVAGAGHDRARAFDWDVVIEAHERAYAEAIAARGR